jgi:hypothetical protein
MPGWGIHGMSWLWMIPLVEPTRYSGGCSVVVELMRVPLAANVLQNAKPGFIICQLPTLASGRSTPLSRDATLL